MKTIYLAGGCFWGTEKFFGLIPGVATTRVGYANGRTENPTYREVCHNGTGHAETVEVVYDPAIIGLSELLGKYFLVIDPTALNRQGHDTGEQYRTGIYWTVAEDQMVVENALALLQKKYDRPILVEAKPLSAFYTAEDYHQKYLDKNPNGYCHIGQSLFDLAAK